MGVAGVCMWIAACCAAPANAAELLTTGAGWAGGLHPVRPRGRVAGAQPGGGAGGALRGCGDAARHDGPGIRAALVALVQARSWRLPLRVSPASWEPGSMLCLRIMRPGALVRIGLRRCCVL